ncbi:esterase/lipase family protein [Nocardioides alcanivorans]|uniref:esterase/lipase family protein n=1 Tax=Nocardioides alcanivorans TaxID=2897352 RepID=UPI001F31B965|nr:alpha/beta fold hydrolase [Nocardioides alcanivorans]
MAIRERSALAGFLSPAGFEQPRMRDLVKEWTLLPEAGRAVARVLTDGAPSQEGADQPVLLVPGFLTGDYSLLLMASTLRRRGYRTYPARLTSNTGCLTATADMLEQRLEAIAQRRGSRVHIVGHSLGGMLARGLVVRRPDLVAGIVTLGSPTMAPGCAHPLLLGAAEILMHLSRLGVPGLMSESCLAGDCARQAWEEARAPMPVGVDFACLYSYGDGFVHARSCIDPEGLPIEVIASHIGMAIDPRVADTVLSVLRHQQNVPLPHSA